MTLGSLFDGIGGFPLAGIMHGIEPLWASEIEPFPILVTRKRFPWMEHLGSVTEIDGAKIPPVDVITFGSPCQDLSVAGRRIGIHDGERSSLFFEAIRIIKEMRANDRANGRTDEHIRPRFAVWENVPGAYSSNGGGDFRAVLQALCGVADEKADVPMPEKGKWEKAGCIVGDGYSVAWRTYDAQYWGVPQRRKRIYLVADFGSERAGEILFEREGVSGYHQQGETEREGTAGDAVGGAGGSDRVECLNPWDAQSIRLYDVNGTWPALSANNGGGQNRSGVVYQNTGIGWWKETEVGATLRTPCGGDSTKATLAVLCLQGNGIDRAETAGCNGKGWRENECYTLNNIDRPAVVYEPKSAMEENWAEASKKNALRASESKSSHCVVFDCRGNGDGETVPTLTGDHQNRVTDYTSVCVMAHGQSNEEITQDIAAYGVDCRNAVLDEEKTHTLQAKANGGQSLNCTPGVLTNGKPPRKYIVRRLTPLECCRLQGYPDGWTENVAIARPTDDEMAFFGGVWATWGKPKTRKQVAKWLANPNTDSAEYKAYGNSLAIPCAADVIGRVARELREGVISS